VFSIENIGGTLAQISGTTDNGFTDVSCAAGATCKMRLL